MYTHGTSRVNDLGHLEIGHVDSVDLKEQFGTPLYVYDVALIRERANDFVQAFKKRGIKAQVAYASKAFSCVAMVQLAKELDLSLDVVSGGELHTALVAGFPVEKIHFHGNNKSPFEIDMAVEAGIGCFVVDNFWEIELLKEAAKKYKRKVSVLLRITPGVEAHTHEYISTGQEDSKFGFDLISGQAEEAILKVNDGEAFDMLGFHCHIGSQIFETTGFVMTVEKVFSYLAEWKSKLGYTPQVLNLGGGFGIRYIEGDTPLPVSHYIDATIDAVEAQSTKLGIEIPEIWIEPGRSLVGDAGTTLYTVGSEKEIPEVRHYLSVDGGMTDNLRPALYQAKYEAMIANRSHDTKQETYSIAGKCCESGDMLIWDIALPFAKAGDILAVSCTGAYGYSMANNYNRIPRPAVVFVENGQSTLVVKRETYKDIVQLDLQLNGNSLEK
ncbi:diaminopimelate decarboxylase [Anaerobacillus isosaccharinicus]|uniref:Diaminopimelate decarboxylase n=1 Tax=Anaerobacillus isosaccharinicus TaxID=1532552 RepID=A0A1S2M3I9_9BACI|nr:diaminopimelate decarboxylase [Anaerobacillus isosaccharinicus]MBA5585752.1 diaminopimelate decarboxylase [Anaerobacillus isosaccharinicus]QOY35948.1 diaminopimelate decarboxylase [Anaerobacillus isosaccharinicus]